MPGASGQADVKRAVEWAVRATSTEFRQRARVATDVVPMPPVGLDEVRLGQILVNLLVNAAQAIASGDELRNEVSVRARPDEHGFVIIEVKDSGSGGPPEVREHLFEPFVTTKPIGVGTGLGLSICHGIVTSVGGEITVESQIGEGTTFRVRLPGRPPAPETTPAEVTSPRAPIRRGRILVVDDDKLVLQTVRRILSDHEVVCNTGAREALAKIDAGEQFDVIVSDVVMPTMTGIELYQTLLERHPTEAPKVLFISGGAVTSEIEDFLAAVPNERLEKPFTIDALQGAVQQAIERVAVK